MSSSATPDRPRVWIALHALVVLAPALAVLAHVPDVPLYGVEEHSRPEWSLRAWRAETLQPALQAFFESHIGLRGFMVRTDSSAYAAIGSETQQSIVIGGDAGTLYSRDSLVFMGIRRSELPSFVASAESFAVHLGSVRRKLHDRGSELVVVIAPNKTMVYDEDVPARYRWGERVDVQVHDALRAALAREGVPFTDANSLFESRKGGDVERLFPRTARHWSRLGGCLALRAALPANLGPPDCFYDLVPISRENSPDFDLYRLQNLWRVKTGPVLNMMLRPSDRVGAARKRIPRALYVGTSFMWTLTELMRHDVDNAVALYYNRSFYDVTHNARDQLPPAEPGSHQWDSYALGRDLYVIEILEEYLRDGYVLPFLKTLDEHLE